MGSQLDVLLEAQDFSQFSDRLTFMGAIAESDADVAATADAAGQEAEWAAQEYERDVDEGAGARGRRRHAEAAERPGAVRRAASRLADELGEEYDRWVAAQAAAAEAAAVATVPSGGGGDQTIYDPPAVSGAAGVAVSAAYSVLGFPVRLGRRRSQHVRLLGAHVVGVGAGRACRSRTPRPRSTARSRGSRSPTSSPATSSTTATTAPTSRCTSAAAGSSTRGTPRPSGEVQLDGMYAYDRPWGAVRVA